jgi:hypothetical protein
MKTISARSRNVSSPDVTKKVRDYKISSWMLIVFVGATRPNDFLVLDFNSIKFLQPSNPSSNQEHRILRRDCISHANW